MNKRNIVLITLDSLRADHCSFMGYKRRTTPTIDEMASKGLYFTNAIAATPGTPASMFSIFTGEFAPIASDEIAPEKWRKAFLGKRTIAEILLENGYSTVGFTPNAYVSSYFGFNKGFLKFEDFLSKKGIISFKWKYFNYLWNFLRKKEVFKPWTSFYNHIIREIRNIDKPFFLWVLLLDTHFPYLPPRKFRKYINLLDMYYYNYKFVKYAWNINLSQRGRQKLIDAYDSSIYFADTFIKRLWSDLESLEPIFIIHGDHGDAFGEHGFYKHPSMLYQELIHVPLVIYNADIKGKVEKPFSLKELPLLILELVGKKHSISTIRGKDWVISKAISDGNIKLALVMKNWKFIRGQKPKDELYYLKNDPYEQKNMIDKYPKLADEMRRIIQIHEKQEIQKINIRKKILRLKSRLARRSNDL